MAEGRINDVLLVEDSQADAMLVQHQLARSSLAAVRVRHVSSLAEALVSLEDQIPDAVLLDLGLPDCRGLEGLQRLRAAVPGLPIVILTGYQDDELAAQALRAGAQEFLYKDRIEGNLLAMSLRAAVQRELRAKALAAALRRERLLQALLERLAVARDVAGLLETIEEGLFRALPLERCHWYCFVLDDHGLPEICDDPNDSGDSLRLDESFPQFLREVIAVPQARRSGGWFEVGRDAAEVVRAPDVVIPLGQLGEQHRLLRLVLRPGQALGDGDRQLLDGTTQAIAVALERTLERERLARTLDTLQKVSAYLPGAVQDRLDHGSARDLRDFGERREVIVLFIDLAGFTQWSEARDPRLVVGVLNGWFDVVDTLVTEHGGIVDKHMGDGILAVFPTEPDVNATVSAACRLSSALLAARPEVGGERFSVHIGAALGSVLLGHVGSSLRAEITVIGDTVNRAARLEDLSPADTLLVDGPMLAAMQLAGALSGPNPVLELVGVEEVRLRGRSELSRVGRLRGRIADSEARAAAH